MHPRAESGLESLDAVDVGVTVQAIREATRLPIGVSTGLWITHGDTAERERLVATWAGLPPDARPDFASLNVREPGAATMWHVLAEVGLPVELGVWSMADLHTLVDSGVAASAMRVLLEVVEAPLGREVVEARALLDAARRALPGVSLLLHGEGTSAWPVLGVAASQGIPSRVGFEDMLHGPSGEFVVGNGDLVTLALSQTP